MSDQPPYSAAELEQLLLERLDGNEFLTVGMVGPVDAPAAELARLGRRDQEYLLAWVARMAAVQEQVAYQFTLRAPRALTLMGEQGLTAWVQRIMALYDRVGLYPAMQLLRGMEQHAERYREGRDELELEAVRGVLEGFLAGLSGRHLRLDRTDADPYTDGTTVFLPPSVFAFRERADNFALYKSMVAHQWAQVRFGTLRLDLEAAVRPFADSERALRALHTLERLRLDACIARELPGLGRAMAQLRDALGEGRPAGPWAAFAARLARPEAGADDALDLLPAAYRQEPPASVYQGVLRPAQVAEAHRRRRADEQPLIRKLLADLAADQTRRHPCPQRPRHEGPPRFRAETDLADLTVRLFLNEEPVAPPAELERLLGSVLLDFGAIPEEYLSAAGEGGYVGGVRGDADEDKAQPAVANLFLYPEWDHKRQHHRKAWCSVREVPIEPGGEEFVRHTRDRYRPLILQLTRGFEALRGEDKRLRRQPHGDDVDIDALVDAWADAACGLEVSENLFTRVHRVERNIAVLFMVDMSGSTKGWINEAERASLIILCEALERLGDRYGIYGFSGMTRTRCEVYPVKAMGEPYDERVRGRIGAMEPRDYTRMGAAIRHLSAILTGVDARTRLLVTLSDGKPDDFDTYYRGDYGIEDTRHALLEARRAGIHPFCITIDKEGPQYLPYLYGHVNWAVVDDVRRLPLKVADIYRRLTA